MSFQILDGSAVAARIQISLKESIATHIKERGSSPCLAVILVGEDPASTIYVQYKEKACKEVGIVSRSFRRPSSFTEQELCALVQDLNADSQVHGILVQLPLPKSIDTFKVLSTIDPRKDVDGLHPMNQGLLAMNKNPHHIPCTPSGVMKLLDAISFSYEGSVAAVVGRSLLVGAPLARLLLQRNATVIQMHSKTREPKVWSQQADLLVVAVGSPKLIDTSWVKPGAVVIDVGIHRQDSKLCGDVDFDSVKQRTSWITPVPKGVGPMTIACLLENCFQAYLRA